VSNDRQAQRVLIVDDEQMIADTLAQILNASGFEARPVFSGEQAVPAAEEFQPEILLTDVIMRGISGIDVAISVSKMLPDCRVILFSGQASTADLLDRAKAQGYRFEIIAKPIHPKDLLKVLNSPQS
jgi:DNA-binding NtrC family response regulator